MKSLSKVIKNTETDKASSYFDEDVFYPRLQDKEKEIREAKRKAVEIIQNAESEAGKILEKFTQEGLRQGRNEADSVRDTLESLLEGMEQFKQKAIDALEPVVVALALNISRKVIKEEIQTNPEIVKRNVVDALSMIIDKEEIIVEVHPEDLELLETHEQAILRKFRDIRRMRFEAKDSITRGGCYIRSSRGDVDASIATQFSQVAKAFGRSELLNG